MNEMLKALYEMKASMEEVMTEWEHLGGRYGQLADDNYPFNESFGNLQDQLDEWIKSLS